MTRVSIRWRMMVWNTAAFAVVLLAFGALLYSLLRQTHYDQVDRGLASRLRELNADEQLHQSPRERFQFWVQKFGKHIEISGTVRDRNGNVIAQAEQLHQFPPLDVPLVPSPQPQFDSVWLPDREHMRRLTATVPTFEGDYTLMLLAELEHVDEELSVVSKVLFITIPATLFVAAALAYFLAYKALAPVENLRQQTNQITAERLEFSFNEVRRFTADASHELRTPVAVIRSEAELGMDASHNPEAAHQRFESILEECCRLATVTSQLLTLSREDAGIFQAVRHPLPLSPLLLEAVDSVQSFANAKKQRIAVDFIAEAEVLADPDRLRQVFCNLLDNAIKYTPVGGSVRVLLQREDSSAVVTVDDNGPGISPEHLSHIFDRFYRVNRSSDPGDGAGLGLSIVKSNVTSLGGRVEVTSTVGQGAVFRIILPLTAISAHLSPVEA